MGGGLVCPGQKVWFGIGIRKHCMSFPRHLTGAYVLIYYRYFIRQFHKAGKPKRPVEFGAVWLAMFDLAKPDPPIRYEDEDCDKDTSRWKW